MTMLRSNYTYKTLGFVLEVLECNAFTKLWWFYFRDFWRRGLLLCVHMAHFTLWLVMRYSQLPHHNFTTVIWEKRVALVFILPNITAPFRLLQFSFGVNVGLIVTPNPSRSFPGQKFSWDVKSLFTESTAIAYGNQFFKSKLDFFACMRQIQSDNQHNESLVAHALMLLVACS